MGSATCDAARRFLRFLLYFSYFYTHTHTHMDGGNMPMPSGPQTMAQKPAMKSGKNRFFGIMPMAIMAIAIVAFLLLIFIAVT